MSGTRVTGWFLPRGVRLKAAGVLRAISHPQRLRLAELLIGAELPVKALATAARIRPHIVSQHLKTLRAAGVVAGRRRGRMVFYRLASTDAAAVITAIQRHHQTHRTFEDGEAI
jgi:DNA-binding transcriptional ArsR family regulator